MLQAHVPVLLRSQRVPWEIDATAEQIRDALADIGRNDGTGFTIPGAAGARMNNAARTSAAMQLRADGTYEYAPHNLALQSENFASASWAKNRSNVSAVTSTADPRGTLTAVKLIEDSTASNTHHVNQTYTSVAGTQYAVSIYAKADTRTLLNITTDGSTKFGYYDLQSGTASGAGASITSVGGGWHRCVLAFTAAVTGSTFIVYNLVQSGTTTSYTGDGVSGLLLWGAQVNLGPTALPYVPTTTAAVYAPAIDWISGIGAYGLRSEESRVNRALYSRDLTQTGSWTKSNATATLTATGIDGVANTASVVTATAGNATVLQSVTNASTARTLSVFLKRRTGTGNIDITLDGGLTWTTQTITSSWARYSITQTLANPSFGVRIVTNGDAVDVDVVQCEDGSFATSPILTYGASATRAADTIVVPNTTAGFIGQSAGTLLADAQFISATHTSVRNILSIDDGSANNRIAMRSDVDTNAGDGGEMLVVSGGVTQADVTNASDFTTSAVRVAAAYAANDFELFRAGASVGTPDVSGTVPATTTLRIGNDSAGASQTNGYVTRVRVARSRLTSAQLTKATT